MKNSRAIAAKTISAVINNKNSNLALQLKQLKATNQLDPLVQNLCFGTLRYYHKLQFIAQQLMPKPLPTKHHLVQHLIFLGIYQLIYTAVPDYAVLQETVAACLTIKKPWAKNLVNAVLRSYLREKDKINQQLSHNASANYAHPKWLIKQLQSVYPDAWQNILVSNNQHPPLTIRIHTNIITRKKYLALLAHNNIQAIPHPIVSTAIEIQAPLEITQLPGFNEGWFAVQDGAAQFTAPLLDLKAGDKILDACAAPGGKTCHLLQHTPDLSVLALDNSPNRMLLLTENLQRLKVQATVKTADASLPNTWWDGRLFDRILIDAPCSATGIIRRQPDIKLTRTLADIQQYATQQTRLLHALWPLLKPHGILLYATCSILPTENEQVIQKFLSSHNNACHLEINLPVKNYANYGLQIIPGDHNLDGFYFAKLAKDLV